MAATAVTSPGAAGSSSMSSEEGASSPSAARFGGGAGFRTSGFAWGLQNRTEWPDGVAVLMSFLSIIWTMSGFDASFHLAEECSNAAVATPRSIVMTAASGSVMGFVLNAIIAYTIVDVDAGGFNGCSKTNAVAVNEFVAGGRQSS